MLFATFAQCLSLMLDLFALLARSEREKNLELLLLRQQVRLLQRQRKRPLRVSWWERLPLAILAAKLTQTTPASRAWLGQSLLLFAPESARAVFMWQAILATRWQLG